MHRKWLLPNDGGRLDTLMKIPPAYRELALFLQHGNGVVIFTLPRCCVLRRSP